MIAIRLFKACTLLALFSVLTGCLSQELQDIRVAAESDPKASLDGYETYAWVAAAAVLRDPDGEWTPSNLDIGAEIIHLVDEQLRAAGKTLVTDSPDLLVAYGVGVDMQALGAVEDPDGEEITFENLPLGGLMLVLIDSMTGYAVWVGAAEGEVQEQPSADLVKKRLDYAIAQMFKSSPL